MKAFFFFNLPSASIFLLVALLTLFLLESDGFLSEMLLLCELALSIQLISLTLQPLFLVPSRALLLSSVGCEHTSLSGLLLKA